MKTIERLKQLLGKCKFGTTKVERTDGDMEVGFPDRFDVIAENGDAVATMYLREQSRCEDGAALLSESHNALPALLAVVEAAENYMVEEDPTKWRDLRVKMGESLAALRALEGGE